MLDPLTAISLASAIVQFTDFGTRLVIGTIKLYQSADGVTAEAADLKSKVTNVRQYADKISKSHQRRDNHEPKTEDEEKLIEQAEACSGIAVELLVVLDALKVKKPAGSGRTWESFRKAVATATPWNQEKIASLERRLRNIQLSMFGQIQVMMSERQSRILMTLKDLADEKLLKLRNEINEKIDNVGKDGSDAVSELSRQLSDLAEASRNQKIRSILDSLDFETRQYRQSEISDTEYRTFEWIYQDWHGPLKQHVGFSKWLQSGNDIYWVAGKAGSGKSVLMNYIANEQRTEDFLRSWAGNTRLIIAKYFFWNAGAPMQKSQQGLLQSLLREIYGQHPELIPTTCPRWERYHNIGGTWSRLELEEAFRTLSQHQSLSLKFCFFIDGMDEYDGGDYGDIVRVLKDLNASPAVKICLSSRPWNIFLNAFGDNNDQRLLLEDYNGNDIQTYIEHRFAKDKQFISLQSREPGSSALVEQIVQNAQGVFLWVRIVVSSLLRGLGNDDSLTDLHKRLQSFPTTLTAYFQHMFDCIEDVYQEEAAETLLICLEGLQPLSLLTLWYYEYEKKTSDYALQAEMKPLSKADITDIFQKIRKRVNARGQDLLDIEADDTKPEHLMYTVRFPHRTIKDFLSKPDMQRKLNAWTSEDFDAKAILCKATLAIAKCLPSLFVKERKSEPDRWWPPVSAFFVYANLLEQEKRRLNAAMVDELQRVVATSLKPYRHKVLWKLDLGFLGRVVDYWIPLVDSREFLWTRFDDGALGPPLLSRDEDMTIFFFTLAVEANLNRYIEYKLATKPHLIRRSIGQRFVLDRALRPLLLPERRDSTDSDTIHLLLRHGADPNEEFTVLESSASDKFTGYQFTLWGSFLEFLLTTKNARARTPTLAQDQFEVTKAMIQYGAAADLRPWRNLVIRQPFGGRKITPLDVLRETFPPSDVVYLEKLFRKYRRWALRQAYIYARRTVRLWVYRVIYIAVQLLTWLLRIIFNELTGVILPLVIIPALSYFIWLVWPLIVFIYSSTAPVLLPTLILSDWVPIFEALVWFNNLLIWRNGRLEFQWPRVAK
ncbi:MAG: hypothetical protein Q9225_004461 [Loekoesia sp. 1 TL-2023]